MIVILMFRFYQTPLPAFPSVVVPTLLVFTEVTSHDMSVDQQGPNVPSGSRTRALPLEPPVLPPLGSTLFQWEGVLREKGISLSSGSSSDSNSFFV